MPVPQQQQPVALRGALVLLADPLPDLAPLFFIQIPPWMGQDSAWIRAATKEAAGESVGRDTQADGFLADLGDHLPEDTVEAEAQ